MQEPSLEDLVGLTLEEAVRVLVPMGWKIDVHAYDENVFDIGVIKLPTISLDIQDGKVYDFLVYNPDDYPNKK